VLKAIRAIHLSLIQAYYLMLSEKLWKLHIIMGKILFVLFSFIYLSSYAQTTHNQESWWDYLNQNRYSDKWGSWLDIQLRLNDDFVQAKNEGEYTAGASYFAKSKFKYTGALTYIDGYPNSAHINHTKEFRPWAMVQLNTTNHYSKWMQWIRVEERIRETAQNRIPTGEFDMNTRLRYQVLAQFPLTAHKYEKGSISFVTSEEIYLNFGKNIVYNRFDQNRFFLGFFYYLSRSNILQLGYTNLYLKNNAPNKYVKSDVLRISVFNTIDFRPAKQESKHKLLETM
jgi:hypothetical protein